MPAELPVRLRRNLSHTLSTAWELFLVATSAFPALAAKLAMLITLIDKINAFAATQEEPTRGKLQGREQALADATEAALVAAGQVMSYGRTNRLPELVAQVRISRSSFRQMRIGERMRLAQRVYDAAALIVPELADYGLTAAKLTELQAKIDATREAVAAPRSTAAAKKVATAQLLRLFDGVGHLLGVIDPRLPSEGVPRVIYKKVHLFCGSGLGLAAFPNGQASIRTRVRTGGGGVNGRAGAGRNPKCFGKGRPCLLVSALSGEAHAGARSQWPKDWTWVWTGKRVEVAGWDEELKRPAPAGAVDTRPPFSRARAALTASLRATAMTARLLTDLPPRAAMRSPVARSKQGGPNGPII